MKNTLHFYHSPSYACIHSHMTMYIPSMHIYTHTHTGTHRERKRERVECMHCFTYIFSLICFFYFIYLTYIPPQSCPILFHRLSPPIPPPTPKLLFFGLYLGKCRSPLSINKTWHIKSRKTKYPPHVLRLGDLTLKINFYFLENFIHVYNIH